MAKRITAILGLSLLVLPWLVSVLLVAGFVGFVGDVRTDSITDDAARKLIPAFLNGYMIAGLIAMNGIIVLGFCVDGMEYRPKWMFWTLLLIGVIWLPLYAAGTMLGTALILYTILNFRKFYPSSNHAT